MMLFHAGRRFLMDFTMKSDVQLLCSVAMTLLSILSFSHYNYSMMNASHLIIRYYHLPIHVTILSYSHEAATFAVSQVAFSGCAISRLSGQTVYLVIANDITSTTAAPSLTPLTAASAFLGDNIPRLHSWK